MTGLSYTRPFLTWVRRRARRLQRAFGIDRRVAVNHAVDDYVAFTGTRAGMVAESEGASHG